MNLIEELSNLDLTGRQARVYLALLQLGSASAIELAKNTGFKHPTVYDVLDSLKARGLVSESFLGKKKRFTAENPDNFLELEARRQRTLGSILPGLRELYLGGVQRPRIRFYQGAEGIKAVNEELLNVKAKEYFYFGSVQEMFKTNGERYLRDYFKRRIERGIWSNAIRNPSRERDEDYMQPGEHNLRRVRYLPTPISEDVAGLYLYDEKIAIHSALKENYAITIESRELFVLLKTIWQCLWNVAVEPGALPKPGGDFPGKERAET
ncbi:MAG: Sugar-specific transcriptional regulator TrmB [Lentisphaerae bacterium ADurb.Bin242]|nr:MAG: Sugar-specific transcriptional regulator TrmB [Lentisphaerae bacterium ADurb.Bin242]